MSNYSKAIEEMKRRRQEEAGDKTAPSSLLSGEQTEKKSYASAIERMRRQREYNDKMATVNVQRAERQAQRQAEHDEWVKTRTQDVIKAELDSVQKEINKARRPVTAQNLILLGNAAVSGITGNQAAVDNQRAVVDMVGAEIDEKTAPLNDRLKKLQDELARRKAYDFQEKYGSIDTSSKEFKSESQYRVDFGKNDPRYNAINGKPYVTDLKSYYEFRNAPLGDYSSAMKMMSEDERAIFNYLYATQGAENAYEYYSAIESGLNKEWTDAIKQDMANIAEKGAIGASALSVATGLAKGYGYVGQLGDVLRGKELDPNASYNIFSHMTGTLRDTVSKDWGPVGSYAYDVGMSMADFLASSGITGGTGFATLILGTGSAADTTIDALERGVPSVRAFAIGTAAGAIEAATEKWSIDTLLEDYSKKGIKQFIISNISSETSEEAISEIANTIADTIIAQDKSYWVMAVNQYKQAGMSESQAFARAIIDKAGDVGLAALGGALSGGAMAGGKVAISEGSAAIGKAAADTSSKLRGQEILRGAQNSEESQQQRETQQKFTVLPTAVEQERAKARERGEVFDVGYERPYTGYANTAADDELDARVNAAQTVTEKTGIRYGASEKQISDALELGKALGREVEFFNQKSADGKPVVDGFYNNENGHIYVNINAVKGLETTISHELVHSFEGTEIYDQLETYVMLEYERQGKSFDAEVARLTKTYEDAGRYQGEEAVKHDMVANFVEKYVLGSKRSIKEITKSKPSVARRMLAWLNNLLSKLERTPVKSTVEQIRDEYEAAMSRAEEAPTNVGGENVATATESEIDAGEEVVAENKTPVTEASERSQDEDSNTERVKVEDIAANLMEKHKKGVITDEEFDLLYESAERQIKGRERRAHNLDVKLAAGEITEDEYAREAEKLRDEVEIDLEKAKKNAEGYNKPKPKEPWMRYSVSESETDKILKSDVDILRSIPRKSINEFDSQEIQKTEKWARKFYRELGVKSPFFRAWFGDWRANDTSIIPVLQTNSTEGKNPRGKFVNKDTGWNISSSSVGYDETISHSGRNKVSVKVMRIIDEVIKHSVLLDSEVAEYGRGKKTSATAFIHKFFAIVRVDGKPYIAKMAVDESHMPNQDTYKKFYHVRAIEISPASSVGTGLNQIAHLLNAGDTNISIADLFALVKKYDSEFKPKPVNSVLLNKDGTPKIFYHGTGESFTAFSADELAPREGSFFFAENREDAAAYGEKIYEVYLRGENLADYDDQPSEFYKLRNKREQVQYLKNHGYDGWYSDMDSEGWGEVSVFEPNQIKSATDNIGTFESNNPDIRYSVSETNSIPDDYKTFVNSIPRGDGNHLRGIVNKLASSMHKALKLDMEKVRNGFRTEEYTAFVESVVEPMVMEYMKTGDISEKTVKAVFEANYNGTDKKKANDMKAFEKTVLSSISNLSAVRSAVLVNEAKERYIQNTIDELAEKFTAEIEADSADEDVLGLEHLTPAAKRELRSVERSIADAAIKALGLDIETGVITDEEGKKHRSEKYLRFIREAVRPITNEYLRTGEVSEAIVNEIFEKKYDDAKVPNKKYSRAMFDRAIEYNVESLKIVRKVMRERKLHEERTDNPKEAFTSEKYEALKKDLDYARRNEEKVKKAPGNLLTEHDEMLIGDVLAGIAKPQSINIQADNKKGAMAVYEAKLATKEAAKAEKQFRTDARDKNRKLSHDLLGGAEGIQRWHEKGNNPKEIEKLAKKGIFEEKIPGGWAYARETFVRNIYDIAPNRETADRVIRELFYPIEQNEAANNKYSAQLIERVKKLNISQEVKEGDKFSEAYAVQYYGEAAYYVSVLEQMSDPDAQIGGGTLKDWKAGIDELFATSPGLDRAKIEKCAKEFRKIYDELYDKINDAYVRNGCRPLGKLEGYFPHFTKREDSFFTRFLSSSGVNVMRIDLPTSINGLTDTFKPGRKYFSHAEHRNGFRTDYDAIEGFESYLATAGKVIFHTDDIQRLRTFANEIRYLTGSDQVKAAMDEIYNNDSLDEEQKQRDLGSIVLNGEYKLSQFVVWLDEYTNIIAGKKSRYDRDMENLLNRKAYLWAQAVKNRVGANMIAANVGSMLTNFIPINQAGAILGPDYMLRGVWQTLMDLKHEGNIWDMSMFLINRRGHESLTQSRLRKWSDRASMPMSWVDAFAAASIIRASYARNLKYGLDESEAMYQADLFAASIMAGRSVGEMPTIFHAKNPLLQLFTQFQLEVNNEFSVLLKDIPRAERKRWSDATVIRYLLYFIGAALYNDLFEKLFGRRPALDPIGVVKETVEDVVEGADAYDAITGFATNAASQLPFVGSLLGGGRLPVTNAWPNLGKLIQAGTDSDWAPKKKWVTVATELFDPIMYLAPPFAGGVLRKVIQTTDAWVQGGRYTYNNAGEKQLQYPVYKENAKDVLTNLFVGELFGPTSLPTGRDWVEGGFGSLSAMKTAVYESLLDADVKQRDAFGLITDLGEVKSEKPETKTEVIEYEGIKVKVEVPVDPDADFATKAELQRQVLRDSDISGEGKSIVYFGLLANDSERALMATLDELGADMGELTNVLMSFKDAGSTYEKLQTLLDSDLSYREKELVYFDRISETRVDDIEAFAAAGMDFDTFIRANMEYNKLYNEDLSASEKATALARWINQNGFDAKEKAVIEEAFKYYSMMPAKAGRYDDFTESGLDDETAYKVASAIADLEPLEGKTSVSELQKCRAVIDTIGSPADQMKALESVMNKSNYKKCVTAGSYGVDAETYVAFREALEAGDKDGNGNISQAEAEAALDKLSGNLSDGERWLIELTGGSMPGVVYLSNTQLAVLWQLANPSWNPKNNPYSKSVGQAVQDLIK